MSQSSIRTVLLGCAAALTVTSVCTAADQFQWHVATNGNDAGRGDIRQPWATPHRALKALEETATNSPQADLCIVLHEGLYRIDQPLAIGRQHVPSKGQLKIRSANGQRAIISGGRRISGWKDSGQGYWTTTLPPLPGGKWHFRELFVNGKRRTRARHPDNRFFRIAQPFPDKRSGFTFLPGDLPARWIGGGELVFLHDWSISRVPTLRVEHDTHRLTVTFPIGSRADHYRIDHFEKHPRYFVEGNQAFLDSVGEWFLDDNTAELRYVPLPGESLETAEVVAPLATELVVVAGDDDAPVRNVHFQAIEFEHCAWHLPRQGYAAGQATAHDIRDGRQSGRTFVPAAIRFERAENCSFTNGRIAHLGNSAIAFGSRTRNCRLENSVIEDISGNGVNLGEDGARRVNGRPWWQADPEQASTGHLIASNRIVHCGQQFFGAVAVWVGLANDMQITLNEISHHPYTGISLGWMWNPTPTPTGGNVVAKNHIHHVMQLLSDGGGIYTLGRQPGTRLLGNVIHDVPLNQGRAESNGMFLDEGSDQIEIAENVIYDVDRSPLRFHKAEQLFVHDNTLVISSADVPPFRYNNTDPTTIRRRSNHILIRSQFDPSSIPPPSRPLVPPARSDRAGKSDGSSPVHLPN